MRKAANKAVLFLLVLGLTPLAASAQTNYDTSPPAQTGAQVFGSYFGADIDSVNLYTGNLNINIPLFSLSARELSVGLSVSYNNQKFQEDWCGSYACTGAYTGGWRVSTPFSTSNADTIDKFVYYDGACELDSSSWYPRYILNAYWVDNLGTKHRYTRKLYGTGYGTEAQCLSNYGAPSSNYDSLTLASMDSDGSILYTGNSSGSDVPKITYRDGTIRYVRTASHSINHDLVTLNGNYLVKGSNGMPTQDAIGRTVLFDCLDPCSSDGYEHLYRIRDSSNNLQSYTIRFDELIVDDPYCPECEDDVAVNNRITWIELPNGKRYNFEYSSSRFGQLTKVTLPSGGYIRYEYDGSPWSWTTNRSDRVVRRFVSDDGTTAGEKERWGYEPNSYPPTTVTVYNSDDTSSVHSFNSNGVETQTVWKTAAGVTLKTVSTSWTNSGVESNSQARDPRVTTTTTTMADGAVSQSSVTYDSDNYVTQQKTWDWGASSAGTLVFQKDITYTTITGSVKKPATETISAINPVNSTFETQGKTEYFYDDYSLTDRGSSVPNHTHSTTASGRGNLTRVRKYKDASNYLETQMKYDNLGNLIETIDPLSHSTTIDFTDNFSDTSKNGYKFAFPKKVTNALSQYVTSKYDWNTGLVKEVTNLRGYTTTTVYDAMNRVTSITEPNSKVTSYAYDDDNRITTKEVTVDSSGNKGRVKTYFDKLYRVVQTRTNDPDGETAVDTVYDTHGRVGKTSNPYRVSGGTAVWTETVYDALGRPSAVVAPDNSLVQYAYSNNVTTTTDQADNQRRYTYNVLGQLMKVEEPNPTLSSPVETTYKYYGFGPLYQSTQSTQTRTWVYNWIGQMSSQTLPESGTTSFTYDGAGRLSTKTDARSIVTTMTYDNINRVTQRSYSDSTPTVSFTYDQSSQTGLRTAMSDGLGSVSYTFDSMDRLTQESRTLTGISGTFSTSYVYNVKGDVTQMTYPSGRVVNLAYATGGGCCNSRLTSVSDGTTTTTLLDSIAFNAAGGVTSQALNPGSNAVTQTFSYNERLQMTQIQATKGGTAVMDFRYGYGMNTGRVMTRTDAIQPEHSANYAYDSLYRLSSATGADAAWGISWVFDTWGNRTSQTPTGLATSKVGSQTIGYSNNKNSSHTYDSSGNTTNDGSNNFAYNAENQQTSMGGGTWIYGYDGEGRRMKKATSSETTYTFYGPGGILSEFTTATTGATAASSSDKTIYRTSEKTGTAVLLFNTSGTVIENNRTLPYGEAWLTDVASANDKKFTTYDRDKESGLDYAMARMYANNNGRFTSPDQADILTELPGTLNRYVYTLADPINYTDPSGNFISKKPQTPAPVLPNCPPGWIRLPDMSCVLAYTDQATGALSIALSISNIANAFNGAVKEVAQVRSMFRKMQSVLSKDKNCAEFLAGAGAKVDRLMEKMTWLLSENRIGATRMAAKGGDPFYGYILEGKNKYDSRILINTQFLVSGSGMDAWGFYRNGSERSQAFTLLHELAHVMGVIKEDYGPTVPANQTTINNRAIMDNCKTFIDRNFSEPNPR